MSSHTHSNSIHLIADDKTIIPYRTMIHDLTNSVTASILLQQILYWWKQTGCQDFYKFREPCNHPDYKQGDSWTEELRFTEYEFDGAIKILKKLDYVKTKITFDRKTIYIVNSELINAEIDKLYSLIGKNQNSYSGKTRLAIREKPDYLFGKNQNSITNTETTTETTTDTIKEINKEKSKSKFQPEKFIDTLNLLPAVKQLLVDWYDMRKDKPTQRAIELVTRDLLKHPVADQIQMIENSLKNGWKGIFELKPSFNQKIDSHNIRPGYSTEGVGRVVDFSDMFEPGAFDVLYKK